MHYYMRELAEASQSNDFLGIAVEWWAIGVSLLIGLAGIFKLDQYIFRPRLRCSIHNTSPDCHMIALRDGGGAFIEDVYYARIRIENSGNHEARGVEVLASSLERATGGDFRPVENFLPLNLKWSHIGGQSLQTIPVKLFHHCDIGYVSTGPSRLAYLRHFGLPAAQSILKLDTIVEPNTGSHLVLPGSYRLTLDISASNAKTIRVMLYFVLVDSPDTNHALTIRSN